MAGEVLLRALLASSLVALVTLAARPGHAADDPSDRALRSPERLTVGVADDLLGQLGTDETTLYYVSNRNTTNQLFVQGILDGRSRQLFDDDADVTWPRVSPDGRSLLYISYRDQASGRLCVRSLPDGGARRCLESADVGLQAEWIDAHRIALVSRPTIAGDLRVMDVSVGKTLVERPLLDRSVTSPSISPDGQWLVYVPVARTTTLLGPAFAAHASRELAIVRLGASAPPKEIVVDLPGQTAQPVFARDGKSLYVVQFFVDSNHDGAVDAGDHGVLFRVPIAFDGGTPTLGAPLQLTEARTNCQYPAPARDRLIMTCSETSGSSLDVYSLPLEGEVPAEWSDAEVALAEADASSLAERELLANHVLARESTLPGRRRATLTLALLYLEAEEFRAADYYAKALAALPDPKGGGLSTPLQALVEQRRASRRREQGRMLEGFAVDARKRLDRLRPDATPSHAAAALTRLVRSEVADSMGDKGLARTELLAVRFDDALAESLARLYYLRADALYRELDDPNALFDVASRLSSDAGLPPDEQLSYAHAAVRALLRGLSREESFARLASSLRTATGGSEVAFVLALTEASLHLEGDDSHDAATRLLAMYASETRSGRRRAVMNEATRRAEEVGAHALLVLLATRHLAEAPEGSRERQDAERRFRRVYLGRAYERQAAGNLEGAAADFDAVVRENGSLEAAVGSIDIALKKAEAPASILARYEGAQVPTKLARFAKAYVLARQLPKLEGEAHARAAREAIEAVRGGWSELKQERMAQSLFGALLHEEYLVTGDLAMAERANTHYLVALELMGNSPRFRALVLGQLGALQADVDNFRIALGYLEDREKLPFVASSEGLDSLLSESQSLLHVGRAEDAAARAAKGLELVQANPKLGVYRVLALDAAALANLAAGHFDRARALYDEEIPLLATDASPEAVRNAIVVRLARAAATMGLGHAAETLPDLEFVESRLGDPNVDKALRWLHASPAHTVRTYRAVCAGLRAAAQRSLGHLPEEARALATRLTLLEEEEALTHRTEVSESALLTLAQLALSAWDQHDVEGATRWVTQAVQKADAVRNDKGVFDRDVLDALWVAASLSVAAGRSLAPDLAAHLSRAATEVAKREDRGLRPYVRWFEAYGPLVAALPGGQASATPPTSRGDR